MGNGDDDAWEASSASDDVAAVLPAPTYAVGAGSSPHMLNLDGRHVVLLDMDQSDSIEITLSHKHDTLDENDPLDEDDPTFAADNSEDTGLLAVVSLSGPTICDSHALRDEISYTTTARLGGVMSSSGHATSQSFADPAAHRTTTDGEDGEIDVHQPSAADVDPIEAAVTRVDAADAVDRDSSSLLVCEGVHGAAYDSPEECMGNGVYEDVHIRSHGTSSDSPAHTWRALSQEGEGDHGGDIMKRDDGGDEAAGSVSQTVVDANARLCKAMERLAGLVMPMPHGPVRLVDETDVHGIRTVGIISEAQIRHAFRDANPSSVDIYEIHSELYDSLTTHNFNPYKCDAEGVLRPDYSHHVLQDIRDTYTSVPGAAEEIIHGVLQAAKDVRPPTKMLWDQKLDRRLPLNEYAERVLEVFRAVKSHTNAKVPVLPPVAAPPMIEAPAARKRRSSSRSKKRKSVMSDEQAQELLSVQVIADSVTDGFKEWLAVEPRGYHASSKRVEHMITSLRRIMCMLRPCIDNRTNLLEHHLTSIIMSAASTKELTRDTLFDLEAGADSSTESSEDDGARSGSPNHVRADRLWHLWGLWKDYCHECIGDPKYKQDEKKAIRDEGARDSQRGGKQSRRGSSTTSSRTRRPECARGSSSSIGSDCEGNLLSRAMMQTRKGSKKRAAAAAARRGSAVDVFRSEGVVDESYGEQDTGDEMQHNHDEHPMDMQTPPAAAAFVAPPACITPQPSDALSAEMAAEHSPLPSVPPPLALSPAHSCAGSDSTQPPPDYDQDRDDMFAEHDMEESSDDICDAHGEDHIDDMWNEMSSVVPLGRNGTDEQRGAQGNAERVEVAAESQVDPSSGESFATASTPPPQFRAGVRQQSATWVTDMIR